MFLYHDGYCFVSFLLSWTSLCLTFVGMCVCVILAASFCSRLVDVWLGGCVGFWFFLFSSLMFFSTLYTLQSVFLWWCFCCFLVWCFLFVFFLLLPWVSVLLFFFYFIVLLFLFFLLSLSFDFLCILFAC